MAWSSPAGGWDVPGLEGMRRDGPEPQLSLELHKHQPALVAGALSGPWVCVYKGHYT